jgi:hypothetical protein
VARAVFEKFGAGSVSWGGLTTHQAVRSQRGGLTAHGMRSNRPRQSELVFALCCIPLLHCCTGSGGVFFGPGGACICAGGLFVLFELWIGGLCSLLEHGFVSDMSSRCPCLRGLRLVLLQVILLFAFPLAFDRLLEFLLDVSFLFLSLVTDHVCCQCTNQGGRLRTMCGSRTGGWSLPGMMSD